MKPRNKHNIRRSTGRSTAGGVAAGLAFGTALLVLTHLLGVRPKGRPGSMPRPETRVRIAFYWDGKDVDAPCWDVDRGDYIGVALAGKAARPESKYKLVRLLWKGLNAIGISGPRPKHYVLNLVPGSVLLGEGWLYVYEGSEGQALAFSKKGPAVLLNGRPVCLNLKAGGADAWLGDQSQSTLASLRSVSLSGEAERDCDALARLRNSGVMIVGAGQYGESDRAKVEAAILATRPRGLFAPDQWQPSQRLRQQADRLTHLWLAGSHIPDLSGSPNLIFLTFKFRGKKRGPLAPLAALRQLRTLVVIDCKHVRSFRPIGKLSHLEYLVLVEAEELRDLSAFSTIGNLRSLALTGCDKLTDISAVSKMKNLRYLTLMPSGPVADLTPLEGLTGLKVIVVSKDDLNARSTEYDRLRKALPNTEIVGICMGSRWIMVVVAIGLAAGVILRTMRTRRKNAQ